MVNRRQNRDSVTEAYTKMRLNDEEVMAKSNTTTTTTTTTTTNNNNNVFSSR